MKEKNEERSRLSIRRKKTDWRNFCGRAALYANALKNMGYINVKSIAGGIDAWVAAGKAVIKPEQPIFD